MKATRNAIADRLLALSAITSQISTFRGVPAVFSTSPIPPAATGRYIVVRDAHIDEEFASKTPDNPPADYVPTEGRTVEHDIAIYEDQTGDGQSLEDVALAVRDAFNRYALTVSGYGTLIAKARGPIEAQDNESVEQQIEGRIITVALTVIKAPTS